VMNITSRYYDGIRLVPGKYDILVTHKGYKRYREWVNVEYDVIVKVILKKKSEAYMTRSFDPIASSNSTKPQSNNAGVSEPAALIETNAADTEGINMVGSSGPGFPSKLTGHYGSVSSLCFSPDGSMLASGSYDSMVILWNINDGSVIHNLNHVFRVAAVAFSPDGSIIVSAGVDKTIKFWDVKTGELLKTFTGSASRIHSVSFDLSGKTLVSGGNNELIIWDVATGKIKNLIVGDDKLYPRFGSITGILYDIQAGTVIKKFNGTSETAVTAAALSPDGHILAISAKDEIKIWKID
jgi:WD40 repeat protein